jgi:hypothetical protein
MSPTSYLPAAGSTGGEPTGCETVAMAMSTQDEQAKHDARLRTAQMVDAVAPRMDRPTRSPQVPPGTGPAVTSQGAAENTGARTGGQNHQQSMGR